MKKTLTALAVAAATKQTQTKQQAFEGAERIVVNASASYNGKYEDNMVYKF